MLRRWRRALAASRSPADESAENGAATAAAAEVGACSRADWRDVRASLDGDGEAYARLVRRYQNDVAACMWRFTRDRGQCEDLVHDVSVEAELDQAANEIGQILNESQRRDWDAMVAKIRQNWLPAQP